MAFTGNTIPYKTEWIKAYQETHYKQPVFPVFADTRFADVLVQGATIKWSYDSDADVQQMDATGAYNITDKVVTDELLTVDQRPYSSFRIPSTERIQDHRPTQQKWAQKAMNRVFWKMDAQMLGAMKAAAASALSAGDITPGATGPIQATTSTAPQIYVLARQALRNQNVVYDENKKWTGYVKLDNASKYPACAIPAELEAAVLLAVGFKPGDFGDQVLKQGYLNMLFGFNTFVSTALPFTINYVVASGNATNGDTFTIGGNTFTLVSGTPTNPGDIKISAVNAAGTATNIAAALSAPYTASATYVPFVRATVAASSLQKAFTLDLLSATADSATVTVTVLGQGTVTCTDTAASDGFNSTTAAVHAIFGTSQSISLVMQRAPELSVSAGSIIGNGATGGYVAQDFVTWTLAGWKVFLTQSKQLVDVPILASGYQAPSNTYN